MTIAVYAPTYVVMYVTGDAIFPSKLPYLRMHIFQNAAGYD